MKNHLRKSTAALLALGLTLVAASKSQAQTPVLVDPAKPWGGYMNVFNLPDYSGGYVFGTGWGLPDLIAIPNGFTLKPATTAGPHGWNPADPLWETTAGQSDNFWVNTNTVPISGNKFMEALCYVDTATLVGSNVTFSGNVVDYALTTNYTCRAFIKVFPANYSSVLQVVYAPLTNVNTFLTPTGTVVSPGNRFFSVNLTATNAGAAHIQYGFVTTGPNARPGSDDANGYITLRTNAVNPLNALVNPGFENGLVGWTSYGNGGNIETTGNHYYNGGINPPTNSLNVLVYEGLNVQKVFPTFSGGANYSGVYQDIPTGPGSTWAATAKALTHQQDHIGVWSPDGTNQCWIEVTFRDAGNNVIETYKSPVIDSLSPVDTWIDMRVTNDVLGGFTLTAPAGTTKVRFQEVYYQPYGYAGGSVYADQMELNNLSPSDPNITTLPLSQTKIVGETASFNVVASGATALSYQWTTNGINLVNGGNISGATSSTLTIANVQKSQAGVYTVDVTDTAGTLSASATLTVKTCAEAANLVENSSFEAGVYAPWATFNGGGLKTNDEFWAGIIVTNYDGIWGSVVENGGEYDGAYQDIPASPGQIFTADGWFFEPDTYPLVGGGQVWLEVQFRNGGTPLVLYKSLVLGTNGVGEPNIPTNTWVNLQATNGYAGDFVTPIPNATYLVAPPNTTTIRYQITMHLTPGTGASGGILYDDMHLMKKLPVTLASTTIGGNIVIAWPTQCSTSYQLVYKDDLTDGWAPIGSLIPGDGSTKTASFPTTLTRRFYSVQTK